MNLFGAFSGKKVFWRFLLSYIVLLVITIMLSSIAYMEALKIVEADSRDRNRIMLEQCMEIIDRQLAQIDKMTMQLALSQDLIDATHINKPIKPSDNIKFRNLIGNIQKYTINEGILSTFYIYLRNSDSIITSETLYDPELFYKKAVKYDDMDYEYWKNSILNSEFNGEYLPARQTTFSLSSMSERKSKEITYIRTIPLDYQRRQDGNIVVLINEEQIQKLVSGISKTEGSWTYITDARGNAISVLGRDNRDIKDYMITQSGSGYVEEYIDGKNYLINYVKSSQYNWTYVAVVPLSKVFKNFNYMRNVCIAIVGLVLIIGIFSALVLSHRNSKPISNMVKMVRQFSGNENEKDINEYQYIKNNISELIHNNAKLKENMDKQLPLIRQAFFERLIKGEISNTKELEAILSQLEIKAEANKYLMLIMHVYNEDMVISPEIAHQLYKAKVFLKETIAEYLADKALIYDIDEKKSALILYFYNDDEKICMDNTKIITRGIYDALINATGIKVYFSAGRFCENMPELSKSYEEAGIVYEYRDLNDEQYLHWYNEIKIPQNTFYYSVDTETRLFNCVKAGDKCGSIKIIEDIYHENIEVRKLSSSMIKYLINQIRGTAIRLIGSLDNVLSTQDINEMSCSLPVNEAFDNLKQVFIEMCDAVNEQKKNRNNNLTEKILGFINEKYSDSNFSLTTVAVKFGFTEGYLSHFFKDQTNENFINYLENLRMIKAVELLESTNTSVSDIAYKVGYNSDQAFRRAFKRVKGVSPISYR